MSVKISFQCIKFKIGEVLVKNKHIKVNLKVLIGQTHNWREEGGDLPCPFSEIGKMCPNFGKNALVAVICGLNFSFQVQF